MDTQFIRKTEDDQEKPPFLKSWNRLYVAVLLNLALLIGLFYLFTRAFE